MGEQAARSVERLLGRTDLGQPAAWPLRCEPSIPLSSWKVKLGAAPPVARSGGPQTQPTRYLDSKNPTLRV